MLCKGNSFQCTDDQEFDLFFEAIGKHGPGYKGLSQYQLRVSLLRKAYETVNNDLSKQRAAWKEYGCSILTDGWTDRLHRSVMNLCVHCKEGTSFIKSIEDSDQPHTGPYIFKWIEDCINEIDEENVIQVVTDNHSSNMMAKTCWQRRGREYFGAVVLHTQLT